MTSGHGKQKQEKKVRSARQRRLEIQETKSYTRKAAEFGGSLACPKRRNIAFEKVASTGGTDEAVKDAKLKDVIGNLCSGKSNLPCTNPLEYLDHSSSSNHGESKGKRRMENEESSEKPVTIFKCGSVSLMGRRRTMEDAVTVVPGGIAGKYSFFAAYDGHGGDRVATACSERLHKLLENEMQETNSENLPGVEPNDWKKVMAACFSRMDDEVKSDGVAKEAVGSTAVAVIVGKEEVVVANCGDSRAVLCSGGVVLPLSDDHKPERPDEKERVESAGGRIIDWNGCRVQGVLSTSRSIGDHYLKPYVISEPEVTVTKRKELDEFLIIATDGLWDVVSSEVACEVVRRFLEGRIRRKSSTELGGAEAAAAAVLAELAISKGSRDNISVIVVQLA